jgi:hypothetical protein
MKNNIDMSSLFLQALSFSVLLKDFNNSDLMNELRIQDEKYFKKIIEQNEKIISLLTKGSDDNGRKSN